MDRRPSRRHAPSLTGISESALCTSIDRDLDTRSGIHHRTVATPPPDYFESLDTLGPRPQAPTQLVSTPHQPESVPTSTPDTANAATHTTGPRGCILILTMVASFIVFSCLTGLYFTLDQRHGYSMGDAFTLAAYIVAVGALVSTAAMARHWPSCRCWKGSLKCGVGGEDGNVSSAR